MQFISHYESRVPSTYNDALLMHVLFIQKLRGFGDIMTI